MIVTVEFRHDSLVRLPQCWQCVTVYVKVWQVWNKVVADEKSHENPVVYDSFQVVRKRK